jgi:hypothetical protein
MSRGDPAPVNTAVSRGDLAAASNAAKGHSELTETRPRRAAWRSPG